MTGHQTWKFDCIDQNSSLSLPIVTNKKIQISFCKIRRKKEDYVKGLPKSFYLNGNTIGFRQEIYQVE